MTDLINTTGKTLTRAPTRPAHRPTEDPFFSMDLNGKTSTAIERFVKKQGSSGGLYVPKAWIGKRCLVVLLDD